MSRFLLLVIFVFFAVAAQAQQDPNDYTFETADTATLYTLSDADTFICADEENVVSDVHRLPFAFGVMGWLSNSISVSSRGQVFIGPGFNKYFVLTPFSVAGNNGSNWNASGMGTGNNGIVRSQTFGSAPYRQYVIAFENMSFKKSSGAINGSFQVVLHESTGKVQYIYGSMVATDTLQGVYSPMLSYVPTNKHAIVNTSTHAVYSVTFPYSGTQLPGAVEGLHSPVAGSSRSYSFIPDPIDDFVDTTITFDATTSGITNMVIPEYVAGTQYLWTRSNNVAGPYIGPELLTGTTLSGMPDSVLYIRVYKSNGNAISTNYASGMATFGSSRTFTSQQSGSWIDNNTWDATAGVTPLWGDTVVIAAGDTVRLNGFVNAFQALHLVVEGVLDFAGSYKTLRALNIEVAASGLIVAHNGSTISNPNYAIGNTISVINNFTGNGYVDMRYPNSILSIGATDTATSVLSVNFVKGNDSLPLLSTLELVSATQVSLLTPLTINSRVEGKTGTFVTNGNLKLNALSAVGTLAPPGTLTINRYARTALFSGAVDHNASHQLKLSYYNFPLAYLALDYQPTAFVAGNEVPLSDTIQQLYIGTYKGVDCDRPLTVTNTLTFESGYINCGANDFTFSGGNFYFYGGGVRTTGWFKRLLYDFPYTGTMETPGSMDRLFPLVAGKYKRYAFLQGAVSGDGVYGIKHHDEAGTTTLSSPYTEDSTNYARRSNAYWKLQSPPGSALTDNAFHFRTSGLGMEENKGLCFATGTAPGAHLATLTDVADGMASRTGLTSALISTNSMYVALTDDIPLPIGLFEFSAQKIKNNADLEWKFSNNTQHDFTVERSADGIIFTPIAQLSGRQTNDLAKYVFIDEQTLKLHNYYRIKTTLVDGSNQYSPIKMLYFDDASGTLSLYPNPAHDILYLSDIKSKEATVTVTFLDLSGKIVSLRKINHNPSINHYNLSVADLCPGLYLVNVATDDGKVLGNRKIVKQ